MQEFNENGFIILFFMLFGPLSFTGESYPGATHTLVNLSMNLALEGLIRPPVA